MTSLSLYVHMVESPDLTVKNHVGPSEHHVGLKDHRDISDFFSALAGAPDIRGRCPTGCCLCGGLQSVDVSSCSSYVSDARFSLLGSESLSLITA